MPAQVSLTGSRLLPQHPPRPGDTRAGRAEGGPRSCRGGGTCPQLASLPAPPHRRTGTRSLPSLFVSICLKILSVRFSGVDSSSGIFITEDTIL